MSGVPLRIEVGPRDLKANAVAFARRDTGDKGQLPLDGIGASVSVRARIVAASMLTVAWQALLDTIHNDMFAKALKVRDEHTKIITKHAHDSMCTCLPPQLGPVLADAGLQEHAAGAVLRAQGVRGEDQGRQH